MGRDCPDIKPNLSHCRPKTHADRGDIPDQLARRRYQTPEDRRAFLISLKKVCAELRADDTNCLIGTGSFYLNQPTRFSNSGVTGHAVGWVEVHHLDNPFEEKKFQERVAALLAAERFLQARWRRQTCPPKFRRASDVLLTVKIGRLFSEQPNPKTQHLHH